MKLPKTGITIIVIMFLALLFAYISGSFSRRTVVGDAGHQFEHIYNSFENSIDSRFGSFNRLLINLGAYVKGSGTVEHNEWEEYFNEIDFERTYTGATTMAYIQPVAREDFAQLEGELPNNAQIYSLEEDHSEVGFIVKYITPLNGSTQNAIGADLFTEDSRRRAILRSLETRSIASTEIIELTSGAEGFFLVNPVFTDDGSDIKALVILGFEIDDLFNELFQNVYLGDNYEIDLFIQEGDTYRLLKEYNNGELSNNPIVVDSSIINFGNHTWKIEVESDYDAFISSFDKLRPYLVGLVVFSLFSTINILVVSLYSSTRVASSKAERASDELLKSRVLLKSVLDSYDAVVYVKDTSNKLILVNKKYEEVSGHDKHDLIGKNIKESYPFSDYILSKKKDQEIEDNAKSVEFTEKYDGKVFRTIKFPLQDKDEDIYAIVGISIDITKSEKFQSELKERNDQLEKLTKLMVGRELKMAELKKLVAEKEQGNNN